MMLFKAYNFNFKIKLTLPTCSENHGIYTLIFFILGKVKLTFSWETKSTALFIEITTHPYSPEHNFVRKLFQNH